MRTERSVSAVFEADGNVEIHDVRGVRLARFQTVYQPGFNSQYPPPLSPDGAVLYVGSWERGLFCYDVARGSLKWRQGPGRVRGIFPFAGGVVVEMCGRGLYRRLQDTGELVDTAKMSGVEVVRRLSGEMLFAGPLRNRYLVLELSTLRRIGSVTDRDVNPLRRLSFVVRDAVGDLDQLIITGFEGSETEGASQIDFTRRVLVRPG